MSPAAPDLVVQKQFCSGWVAGYLEKEILDPSSFRRGETVVQLLKSLDHPRPKILEVGCANGWLSAALAHFGQVTGVDLADKPIAAAKAKYPHIDFIASDFLTREFPASHFDIVVSVDVMSHVDDQRSFMDRLASSLKGRGTLILICPHKFI